MGKSNKENTAAFLEVLVVTLNRETNEESVILTQMYNRE